MGSYAVSEATKSSILDAARHLFYQYGPDKTTYDMLCKEADVNRSLLSYHFKTKDGLVQSVYSSLDLGLAQQVDELFPDINYNVSFALNSLMLFRALASDQNLLRFYSYAEARDTVIPAIRSTQERFIRELVEHNNVDIDEHFFRTLVSMFVGTESQLVRDLADGYLTEHIDLIVQRDMEFVYDALRMDREISTQALTEAKKLAATCKVTIPDTLIVRLER